MAIVCIARCIHNGRYSGHLFHCLVYSTSCSGRQISPENQRLDHIATPPPPPPLPGSSKRPTKRSKPKRVVVSILLLPSSPVFFSLFRCFFFRSCIFSLTRSRRSSDGSFFCYRLPLALFLFDFQKNVTACHVISSGSVALVNTIRLSPRDPSSKTFVGMAPADRYRK